MSSMSLTTALTVRIPDTVPSSLPLYTAVVPMVYRDSRAHRATTTSAPLRKATGCRLILSNRFWKAWAASICFLRRSVKRSRRAEVIRGTLPAAYRKSWASPDSDSGNFRCRLALA